MSFEDLLLSESQDRSPAVKRGSILTRHNSRYPLNEMGYPEHAEELVQAAAGRSERVRVWSAVRKLISSDLRVLGPKGNVTDGDEWDVKIEYKFDYSGEITGVDGFSVSCRPEIPDLPEVVQQVLQEEGLPVVVTVPGRVVLGYVDNGRVYRGKVSRHEVDWRILGQRFWPGSKRDVQTLTRWMSVDAEAFGDYDTVQDWAEAGFKPRAALPWVKSTEQLSNPWYAKDWMDAGIDADTARRWSEQSWHLGDYERSEPWVTAGIDPVLADCFVSLGLGNPTEAQCWIDAKVTAEQMQELTGRVNQHGFAKMTRLLEQGVSLDVLFQLHEQIQQWGEEHLRAWLDAGFSADEIYQWNALGEVSDPDRAQGWIALGADPVRAGSWAAIHHLYLDPTQAQAWIDAGMSLSDARRWGKCGVFGYDQCAEWMDLHPRLHDPERVQEMMQEGLTPSSLRAAQRLLAGK